MKYKLELTGNQLEEMRFALELNINTYDERMRLNGDTGLKGRVQAAEAALKKIEKFYISQGDE